MNILFFSSRRRHTILRGDWSSDVCSSDLGSGDRPGRAARPGNELRGVFPGGCGRPASADRCPKPSTRLRADGGGGRGGTDRKSTRLNSSHLVTSYAVFCLKTKHAMTTLTG